MKVRLPAEYESLGLSNSGSRGFGRGRRVGLPSFAEEGVFGGFSDRALPQRDRGQLAGFAVELEAVTGYLN